jgi:cellulose synthase operon protein YhjU
MAFWGFYFAAKLYLYLMGILRPDFLFNLLFLILLILPVPSRFRGSGSFSIGRFSFNLFLGGLLLWHDSWLPPLADTLHFVTEEGLPSKEYLYRFLAGFIDLKEFTVLFLLFGICIAVRNRIRFTPVIFILLLIVPLREFGRHERELKHDLDEFHRSEAARVVRFGQSPKENFDVVILHVCSLSWDDLETVGLKHDPFFRQFDYLFDRFNSVTSYSNPSAIRVLRSSCGQQSHDALYADAPEGCYLLDDLRKLGYKTYATFNHDGKYYDFAAQAEALGHIDPPLSPIGLPAKGYNFDNSILYDDYAALERWWKLREVSGADRAAVYYNTISLHDGAHLIGDPDWWKRDRAEQYKEYVRKLFGDFTKFFELIHASGRNVVVLFVPEHGMALRGNALQAAGLRDIPLPRITTVPVGIKLIGSRRGRSEFRRRVITRSSSYLALSHLLAGFVDHPPFNSNGPDEFDADAIVANAPETDFVAENQNFEIMMKGGNYFLNGKQGRWIQLSTDQLN